MIEFCDGDGNPCSRERWMQLVADKAESQPSDEPSWWRVASDTVGPYWISTVWIGINMSFGDYPPLVFETMVFVRDRDMVDEYCLRYSSRAEALAGHEAVCAELRVVHSAEARGDDS